MTKKKIWFITGAERALSISLGFDEVPAGRPV
jgi:hypothetical protein